MTCASCPYWVYYFQNAQGIPCIACLKMPSNNPDGCGYMIIDIADIADYTQDRPWFCPLKEQEDHHETNRL